MLSSISVLKSVNKMIFVWWLLLFICEPELVLIYILRFVHRLICVYWWRKVCSVLLFRWLWQSRVQRLCNSRLLEYSLKSDVLNVGFKITRRVKMGDASKLLFALTSNCRKDMIVFPYPFNLFESPLIISLSCIYFQHGSDKNLRTSIIINPKFLQITIFSDMFPAAVV